ncbi:hypothetical protein JCM10207_003885 [Rhodosporidiobolus poonsookiae]
MSDVLPVAHYTTTSIGDPNVANSVFMDVRHGNDQTPFVLGISGFMGSTLWACAHGETPEVTETTLHIVEPHNPTPALRDKIRDLLKKSDKEIAWRRWSQEGDAAHLPFVEVQVRTEDEDGDFFEPVHLPKAPEYILLVLQELINNFREDGAEMRCMHWAVELVFFHLLVEKIAARTTPGSHEQAIYHDLYVHSGLNHLAAVIAARVNADRTLATRAQDVLTLGTARAVVEVLMDERLGDANGNVGSKRLAQICAAFGWLLKFFNVPVPMELYQQKKPATAIRASRSTSARRASPPALAPSAHSQPVQTHSLAHNPYKPESRRAD